MLISFKWIKGYVSLPDSVKAEEVAALLKASTAEVESVTFQGAGLVGVCVGEILEIKKHPNADKLHIAQVDVGEEKPRQVIFGQMVEMKVGYKIPVALAPTVLPNGKKIERVDIRGILTEGMLCLDQELGLQKEGVSIKFFDKKVKNGTSLTEAANLDDYIFEIDNKTLSHRPDLWGHYGIAREVAVLYKRPLKEYSVKEIKKLSNEAIKLKMSVEDKKLCPRYMAVAIGGVKVGASPAWLQEKITAVGLRSINNIVDITNYVMYDLGQPMHAFDNSKLSAQGGSASGGKSPKVQIVVRRAKEGEKFVTLDEKEHTLTSDNLLIATEDKAVALAGVMGGLESGISESTNTIVFESANFDASSIRKTSTKLGLRTDSSMRFEKSLDPALCELALQKAIELTLQICPGAHVASKIIDESSWKPSKKTIVLNLDWLNKFLGCDFKKKEVEVVLQNLGFKLVEKGVEWKVEVPSWRATKDIQIVEDLAEEVARIYGFNNIKSVLPNFSITPPEQNQLRLLERKIKDLLCLEHGFTEVYNYSFVSPITLDKLELPLESFVELDNPVAKDRPYLRASLLPNLLENTEKNAHFSNSIRLFEVGKIFEKDKPGMRARANGDELLPRQKTVLGFVYTAKGDNVPFFEVSAVLRGVLDKFGVKYKFEEYKGENMGKFIHPSRQAVIKVGDDIFGMVAELHPSAQQSLGIDNRVAVAEIGLDNLLTYVLDASKYEKISQYPSIVRDIAFVIDKKVRHSDIVSALQAIDQLIRSVELFDVFEGANIGEGKKSMAYHITYRSDEKTLESGEVDKVHGKVFEVIEDKLGGEIRK